MVDADITKARAMADFFRLRGFEALPSDPNPVDGRKKPLCRFKEYWDTPAPAGLLDRFPTSNLQIICGRRSRLLVIDLDGPEAREWWATQPGRKPRTWTTHSGGDGIHLWYRLPADYPRPLPKAFLWKGDGAHSAVERLCDKSLVMAPPSIHPETGKRYRFTADGGIDRIPMPADCPQWVLGLPPLKTEVAPIIRPSAPREKLAVGSGRYRASDVVEAIPDVIALVGSWGVRFTGSKRGDWFECRAVDRDDNKPSAAVSARTGAYVDLGSGTKLGLFDLAATLGISSDWREAVASLGDRFHARQQRVA